MSSSSSSPKREAVLALEMDSCRPVDSADDDDDDAEGVGDRGEGEGAGATVGGLLTATTGAAAGAGLAAGL